MIRIIHVISDLDTGGAEVMLAKKVGAMKHPRFTHTVTRKPLAMFKGWIANAFLVAVGTVIGLLLFEVALRAIDYSSPNFYRFDLYTGATLRAGAEGWWRKEGESYVKINSDGLRDREHQKPKPSGTFRIAVLGDSYAEAMQVAMEDTFWKVLELELQTCQAFQGRQIEVINFGVAGYGTAQEVLTLRHRGWDYSPDLVLLAFLSGNDPRNNVRALEQDPMRPYFVYRDDALVLDASFQETLGWRLRQSAMRKGLDWLIDHLRILQLLNEARYFIKDRITRMNQITLVSGIVQNEAKVQLQHEVGLDTMVYLEPTDPIWKEAWRVTEGLIVQLRNEVRERGADLIVVTLTNGIQVDLDPKQRSTYAQDLGAPDLLYPERRIKSLGDREGIPVLTLAQPFAAYAEQHKVFLHGFKNGGGHWNAEGHHLAGKLIAEKICSGHANPI